MRATQGMPGVVARDSPTLELRYHGRVLHVGKAPSGNPAWDVRQIDWSTSDVRDDAARVNSRLYQPLEDTLFEDLGAVAGQRVDPQCLTNLHYVWLGLADGSTREWIGFPRIDAPFWFAAVELGTGSESPQHGPSEGPEPMTPNGPLFDQLPEPLLPISRRSREADARHDQGERGA